MTIFALILGIGNFIVGVANIVIGIVQIRRRK